jgi:hypothetical protein
MAQAAMMILPVLRKFPVDPRARLWCARVNI